MLRPRTLSAAAVSALSLAGLALTASPASANGGGPPRLENVHSVHAPRVVASHLNNPRQLAWAADGRSILVAEAGKGGPTCGGSSPEGGPQCLGLTGSVTQVRHPDSHHPRSNRIITGLLSSAGPDGTFATGSDGVSTDGPYTLVQETYFSSDTLAGTPLPEPGGSDQNGHLLVSFRDDSGGHHGRVTVPWADIANAERTMNPGGGIIDSDPYAVVVVNPTPRTFGDDEYALVADAAANAVWKVTPNWSDMTGPDGSPTYTISVFASWPDRPVGSEEGTEFVPTSLALDGRGCVYVGGLGSLVPGAGEVVKFSLSDGHEQQAWTGFTAVTGVAVDPQVKGGFYVSQLFGPEGPPAGAPTGVQGDVVRVGNGHRYSIDVPWPAGLLADRYGRVYVSALSVMDDDGPDPASVPAGAPPADQLVGQVWQIQFPHGHHLHPDSRD